MPEIEYIDYSCLPQRIRRVIKTYEDKVATVIPVETGFHIKLKSGYQDRSGETSRIVPDGMAAISFLKYIIKIPKPEIMVAQFSFTCPCGTRIAKGSNYASINGVKTCLKCSIT